MTVDRRRATAGWPCVTRRRIALASVQWAENTSLGDLLSDPYLRLAYPDMLSIVVADLVVAEDTGRVSVVDRESGRIVGIVARRDLLQARAGQRREEQQRERFVRQGAVRPVGEAR